MIGNEGISVADALALRNSGSDGDFGGNNGWWIVLLILLFANGGWNRNNSGDNGNGGGGVSFCYNPFSSGQGITDAFNFNQLDNGIRSLANGLCDGFYATSNQVNSVLSAIQNCCCQTQQSIANVGFEMAQGFCGVDKSIMQNDFHNQAGFNNLANQISSGYCNIERGQDDMKYALAQATNQILVSNDKNTDRIINYLTQTELDALRTELQSAQFQLSQLSQTSNIVNQLMPVAKPAYLTCSPYAAVMGYNNYGFNNGCGCGCGNCA